MKHLSLVISVVSLAIIFACSKRPSAGDYVMPLMDEMNAVVGNQGVELRCQLSSVQGIVEAGSYVDDGTVETRYMGRLDGNSIVVELGGLKSRQSFSYRFYISNGEYEKLSDYGSFYTNQMPEFVVFDDPAFKEYCISNFDSDHDGELTAREACSVMTISCPNRSIRSLKGIEYFTALRELDCHSNQIDSIDVSGNSMLTHLFCYDNLLKTLALGEKPILAELDYGNNLLRQIDLSGCPELRRLSSNSNQFTSIDISNNRVLEYFDCCINILTGIDFSLNTELMEINLGNNFLRALDISMLDKLEVIRVYENDLSELSVARPEIVRVFDIGDTRICKWDYTDMPLLEDLGANNTPMGRLPVFVSDANIKHLHLSGIARYIDDADYFCRFPNLVSVNCCSTKLSKLNFPGNTKLESIWAGYMSNARVLDLDASPNIKFINIDADTKLETVYVHPDVVIENIEISSEGCDAEIRHK